MKILLPVDGSEPSNRAVDQVIKERAGLKLEPEVHLLNVQPSIDGVVGAFVSKDQIKQYHREEGTKALAPAMKKLEAAGVKYEHHIGIGHAADVIVAYAAEKHCERIVMATHGVGSVSGALLGSVASKVVHLAPVPVLLVK